MAEDPAPFPVLPFSGEDLPQGRNIGGPSETRTLDPRIKSPLLYQLS